MEKKEKIEIITMAEMMKNKKDCWARATVWHEEAEQNVDAGIIRLPFLEANQIEWKSIHLMAEDLWLLQMEEMVGDSIFEGLIDKGDKYGVLTKAWYNYIQMNHLVSFDFYCYK